MKQSVLCLPARALWRCVAVMSLFFVLPAGAAESMETRRHDADGFSIQVPAGWVPIPQSALAEVNARMRSIQKSSGAPPFRYGYQRETGPPYPVYPYLFLQVNDTKRMSEREFKALSKQRAAVEKGIRKAEDSAEFGASKARLGEMVYDEEAKVTWMNVEMQVEGVGPVQGLTGIVPTEKGFLQVNCYAEKPEFAALQKTFDRIVRSVELAEGLRYKPRGSGLAFMENPGIRGGVIGGLIGGLVAAIMAARKAGKKPSTPSRPPPLPGPPPVLPPPQ